MNNSNEKHVCRANKKVKLLEKKLYTTMTKSRCERKEIITNIKEILQK